MNFESSQYISFEERFASRKTVDVFGDTVEYVDLVPPTDKLQSETPVLFAPGWAETIDLLKGPIQEMYEKGRRVLCLSHSRHGSAIEHEHGEHQNEEFRKASALLKMIEGLGVEKVDVIAHSEGGINTCIAASIAPEKFRTIIFTNIAGLIGEDNLPSLVTRFAKSFIKETRDLPEVKLSTESVALKQNTWREVLNYIVKNIPRAAKEAQAISEADVFTNLRDLHEKGINVVVVSGVDDAVFPMGRMQEYLKQHMRPSNKDGLSITPSEDFFGGFFSIKGGHNELYSNPQRFIAGMDAVLARYEKGT